MKTNRKNSSNMRKYYQLILVVVCFISIITLLIYRHEYYRLRYVLEVLNFFGKPGLSEIEFCGPGFNATMLSEIMRNSSMEVRDTPPLFQQIDEHFYTYSSFLRSYNKYEQLTSLNPHEIDTIVVGKMDVKPNFRCNIWIENKLKPRAGRFTYKIIPFLIPENDYRLYIFNCAMSKDFGKPVGISFYKNDYNINPIHAPINRLIQLNTKKRLREINRIRFINTVEPTICVLPNKVPIVSRDSFIEFLVFHHIIGVNHFTIYDSMISEDIIKRLNLLPSDITQWHINFFPLNYPFVFAQSYNTVKGAVELDCLYRNFQIDKDDNEKISHTVVLSWDEFIVPRYHDTLKGAFDDFDPRHKLRSLNIKPLLFCLNQADDENVEIGYPDIVKKTHYYTLNEHNKDISLRNVDTSNFGDLFQFDIGNKTLPIDVVAVHKYTECGDKKSFNPFGYNETQLQELPHKFEGAMIKFSHNLISNKIYRLYASGQIWEKTSERVRDML